MGRIDIFMYTSLFAVYMRPMRHDQWSEIGERHLGEGNIRWAEKVGPMVLLKSILNDYWADAPKVGSWEREKIDMVMSKLYWCWVRWLDNEHPTEEE